MWRGGGSTELIGSGGDVIGVLVSTSRRYVRIRFRKGVVLATGGFSQSLEWRRKLMSPQFAGQRSVAFEENKGCALELGVKAGAVVDQDHDAPAYLVVLSIMNNATGPDSVWIHSYDRGKPHLVIVDRHGKRFASEST